MRRVLLVVALLALVAPPVARAIPGVPPLRTSPNVELLGNVPGSYAGLVFGDGYAYATGWGTGLTVFDISTPETPTPVGVLPLPHFENEDVDLCGDTLLIANDRGTRDLGGVLHVIDVATPSAPRLITSLPMGLTGEGRGPGHIASFVKKDCSQVWVDGGDDVEVIDLSDRENPTSLGFFRSYAAAGPDKEKPAVFVVTHDTELDSFGTLWSVGGGGVAGYKPTNDPPKPALVASSGANGVNVDYNAENSPYNDFIMHNSQRAGKVLLVTEEDYVDAEGGDETPGGCRGQGKFETWQVKRGTGNMRPIDTWQTELNGFAAGGEADDSKAPITANCSSHWFDHRGGVAAVGWYEQGVRFLDVRNPANIRQVGYYLPVDGATWAAYWVPGSKDLVYTADVSRGLDVLRIGNADDAAASTVEAPLLPEWFGGTPAFTRSSTFGWSCALPISNLR